jgi:hypothetical protein
MILQNKIVPVALGAALLGGSVGAFVMRPAKQTEVASAHTAATQNASAVPAQNLDSAAATSSQTLAANSAENTAFREGFAEGVRAARDEGLTGTTAAVAAPARAATTERVVYRNSAPRTRYARSRASSNRQVYYDYNNRPRGRSFWQKHRDKLTVAMGAGGGALIGGLVGGKKGALIGGLAGGGGSALYTYKLRKRDRRY